MKYKKIFLIAALFIFPAFTLAAGEYKTLANIPGINDPNLDFGSYINALYTLAIALAALLAVIKIIIAGIKWMMTDIVTSKQDAKNDIWGATMGLLLILAAVLFLSIINPDLTDFNLFDSDAGTPSVVTLSHATYPANASKTYSAVANNASQKNLCETTYSGTWYGGSGFMADGGPDIAYCETDKFTGNTSVRNKELGCPQSGGTYDCTSAKTECSDAGGTPTDVYSLLDPTKILPYKIMCN